MRCLLVFTVLHNSRALTHYSIDEWIESCISNPDKLAQIYSIADQGTQQLPTTSSCQDSHTDNDGIIKGSEAVKFFRGSGAPDHVLSYVWRVASRDSHALSTDTELRTALGLLLEARNGRLVFAGAVRHDADTARRACAAAIAQHPTPLAIQPDAQATYSALFSRMAHEDCEYVELAALKRFLAASSLHESALDAIITAVVGDEDEIDQGQFASVVHLAVAAVESAKTMAQSAYTRHYCGCCIIPTPKYQHDHHARRHSHRLPYSPPCTALRILWRPHPPPLVFRL